MTEPNSTVPADASSSFTLPMWWKIAVWLHMGIWSSLQLPFGYGLQPFVFFDGGWALSTDALLREGLVPTQDFAYFYGLFTLVVNRAVFAIFGPTPLVQCVLCYLCMIISTRNAISFACSMRLGLSGRLLLLASMPLAIMPVYHASPTHALENALLTSALAQQAAGRLSLGLMFCSICFFVKPSLAALEILILLTLIVRSPGTYGMRLRRLIPAVVATSVVVGLLLAFFGYKPILATLIPVDARKLYDAEHYGFFFGVGRRFWFQTSPKWWYYPFTPTGFWLVGTLLLIIAVIRPICLRQDSTSPGMKLARTCLILHVGFVCLFFGNEMSWHYYTYVLVFGLVSLTVTPLPVWLDRTLSWSTLLCVMGQVYPWLLALAINTALISMTIPARTEATAGLIAGLDDQRGWARVRELVDQKQKVFVLSPVSAGRVIMPDIDSPRSWYLLQPIAKPREVEDLRRRIEAADWMVVNIGHGNGLQYWAELRDLIQKFSIVEDYKTFRLARRIAR